MRIGAWAGANLNLLKVVFADFFHLNHSYVRLMTPTSEEITISGSNILKVVAVDFLYLDQSYVRVMIPTSKEINMRGSNLFASILVSGTPGTVKFYRIILVLVNMYTNL